MTPSPISPSLQSMQHDKSYYIHSGDLVFLVENILFRVHRYFFERESVYFQTLLATPHPEKNEPAPGSSDSSAIMLDTTASQFSRFLWVFYNPKYSLYDEASLEDWKSILSLSHRFLFPEIKNLAIRHLQTHHLLTPVHRIQLYHSNAVDRALLISDYLALCQRPEPLSLFEGLDLGLETTLMVARTREEIRTPRSPEGVFTPLTPTLRGPELIDHIGKLFVGPDGNENEGSYFSSSSSFTPLVGVPPPATRPTIVINGAVVGDEKTRTAAVSHGSNGFGLGSSLNPNSGGSPLKPQVTRQMEQQQQQQQQNPLKQNQPRGTKAKNLKKKEQQQQQQQQQQQEEKPPIGQKTTTETATEPATTTTATTKSPTEAAETKTKEGAEQTNEGNQNQSREASRIDTPVAGQQGAGGGGGGGGGGANGNGDDNQEKEKETTEGGVDVQQGQGDVKPGATTDSTEAGVPKVEGAGDTQGVVDSEANGGGGGGAGQTDGDVDKDKDKDKDKTTDTQQSPTTTTTTTTKPGGQQVTSPVNGVGVGEKKTSGGDLNGNNRGRAKKSSAVDNFFSALLG